LLVTSNYKVLLLKNCKVNFQNFLIIQIMLSTELPKKVLYHVIRQYMLTISVVALIIFITLSINNHWLMTTCLLITTITATESTDDKANTNDTKNDGLGYVHIIIWIAIIAITTFPRINTNSICVSNNHDITSRAIHIHLKINNFLLI
jgi:hypothetical protein